MKKSKLLEDIRRMSAQHGRQKVLAEKKVAADIDAAMTRLLALADEKMETTIRRWHDEQVARAS